MRAPTLRDIVATWFVSDAAADASAFPQTGHDSSSQRFQDIYWRCIASFHATAVRQAPGARHVLYTNCATAPVVDGVDLAAFLGGLGVGWRVLPIRHRLGKDKVSTWNNQFYILDIIDDLDRRDDYDTVMVLDSDCVWVKPLDTLLSDLDRRGVLTLNIPYSDDFLNNGASRIDMRHAAFQLAGVDFGFVPHYSGGELFAATREQLAAIRRMAAPMWAALAAAPPGAIKVFEEGQFLSIIYEAMDIPTGTADAHCRRMWTALRLNNVSAEDIYSSRCLWHLPMEKKTGFPVIFKAACDRSSWLWTCPAPELPGRIARAMGLESRTAAQWLRQVAARARFHIERRIPART